MAHVSCFLCPVWGPVLALALSGRNRFERTHAAGALVLNVVVFGVWMLTKLAAAESPWRTVAGAAAVIVLIGASVVNMRRYHGRQPPLMLGAVRSEG